jgi:hypothetical protein
MTDYSKLTDGEIRFKIAYLKGFADLGMPPNYPVDIKAAWELVEDLNNAGYGINLFIRDGIYVCQITSQDHTCTLLADGASDTTAQHSICLAWLAWHEASI